LVDIYPLGHIILTWADNNLLLLPMRSMQHWYTCSCTDIHCPDNCIIINTISCRLWIWFSIRSNQGNSNGYLLVLSEACSIGSKSKLLLAQVRIMWPSGYISTNRLLLKLLAWLKSNLDWESYPQSTVDCINNYTIIWTVNISAWACVSMLHASLRTNKCPFEFPWFDLIENHIHNLQEIVLIIIQLSGQWISVHEHVYQFLNVFVLSEACSIDTHAHALIFTVQIIV
jgi:hypothetical protein